METRSLLLVTEYDGGAFAGWQRQSAARTVQGEMERVLARLCDTPVVATGAGRTDAGVHARGQGVGVRVAAKWTAPVLQKAMNALLPPDIRIAEAHEMTDAFHPRRSAIRREYAYFVGMDAGARSPFRRRYEWAVDGTFDGALLQAEAEALLGEHVFRAFAVAGTAPETDDHRCRIERADWQPRDGGYVFHIAANRFLHHMVRFLVGTMVDVARGRRAPGTVARLLTLSANAETSAPAAPHGLFLEQVTYPSDLYLPNA